MPKSTGVTVLCRLKTTRVDSHAAKQQVEAVLQLHTNFARHKMPTNTDPLQLLQPFPHKSLSSGL